MTRDLRTVVSGMSYTECPRWHDDRLWFADFYTHAIYSVREDGTDLRTEIEVPHQPSGLGWLPDGRLVYVSMKDTLVMRQETDGSLVEHADVGAHVTGHPNDMVVDAEGRCWLGNFGFDLMGGADIETAGLLRIDLDGSVTAVADDLWFPNGSVITPDGGTLIVDETFGNRVSAFEIRGDGSLGPRRDWAKFGEPPTSRAVAEAIPQAVAAPTAAGSTPRGVCGSPTRSTAASCGCGRAARSSTRSRPAAGSSPACWVAPTGRRCSSAAPPTSTSTHAAPPARPRSRPSRCRCRTPGARRHARLSVVGGS